MFDFIDLDVLYSPGFVLLSVGALSATTIGYLWSKSMEAGGFPLWQLLVIMMFEVVACYYFVSKA